MTTVISSPLAPKPAPYFSPAMLTKDGTIYVSGACGVNPKDGTFIPGTVQDRTAQALKNINALLEAAGSGLGHVVSATIYLSKYTEDFGDFNVAYMKAFADASSNPLPARCCIGVAALPQGTDVEISVIAVKP